MVRVFRPSCRFILTAVALCVLGYALAGRANAAPSISLSVKAGPPTTALRVSGSGFGANKAVDLFFDVTNLALAVTDSSGNFANAAIAVPQSALPGKQWITAMETDNGTSAQTPFLVQTNWSEYQFDAAHSGFNPYENVIGASNVGGLTLKWSNPINGLGDPLVVANGVVYLSAGEAYALSAATGTTIWHYDTHGNINSAPVVAGGVVYVPAYNGGLFALNARTGKLLWFATTGGPIYSSPMLVNGVVYFGSYDTFFYALDASSGKVLWSYQTGGAVNGSPAVVNGIVYVTSFDGNLYALDAKTGGLLWKYETGSSAIWGSPTVSDGVVFFGNDSGTFYALDASSGSFLWSYLTGQIVYSSAAVANGLVYLPSWDGNMYALNATTGTVIWSYPTAPDDALPTVANGVVYIGTASYIGEFYALDAVTGSLLWSYKTPANISAGSAVVNGMVYLAGGDKVYAFGLATAKDGSGSSVAPDPRSLRADPQLSMGRP
jgi:outer membrane protein assembly factor BamB